MATDVGVGYQQLTLNANTGAYIVVLGTRLSRMVEIWEDGSANSGQGQGLQVQLPDPASPTGVQNWLPARIIEPQTQPLKIGDIYAANRGPYGGTVANGPGVQLGVGPTAATAICQIRSASALTTIVNVSEFS